MKLSHILQYHNATIVILIGLVLVLGTYVFAQTDAGQQVIGQAEEKVISVDNKALLEADLENFDMGFKILNIKSDNASSTVPMYYVGYSYRDLVLEDNVWQFKDKTKTAEISEKAFQGRDLGDYLAEEFSEVAFWRQKELKEAQDKARQIGPTEKQVVTEYSGLIGKVLDLKNAIFPGYEPVVEVAQIAPMPEPGPGPVGPGLVPAQGQPQELPLQGPLPVEEPEMGNATTTAE